MLLPKSRILFFIILVVTGCGSLKNNLSPDPHYVILISIDGYRYDYTERFHPPNLEAFAKAGVAADSLQSVYPSKTFPNHYSIVTGMYADHHGIVANEFYDRQFDAIYKINDSAAVADGRWYGGTPLWSLAESQGIKSACFFWPGSEAKIAGYRPSYFKVYNSQISNQQRADQIVQWLKLPATQRPHFLTLYFSIVDSIGHRFGPDSPEEKTAVLEVDTVIGQLQTELNDLHLPIDIVIVSDHGMQTIDPQKIESVDKKLNLKDYLVLGDGTHAFLYLKKGRDPKTIDRTLSTFKSWSHHFHAYAREATPSRWHSRDSQRIGDIVLEEEPPFYLKFSHVPWHVPIGNHGYDPIYKNMSGIFYARGPDFREPLRIQSFENIHIYPLIAKILHLGIAQPVDGRPDVLQSILQLKDQGI